MIAAFPWLVGGLFAAAAFTLLYLLFFPAPYGRHVRGGWGPTTSARAGWLIMEVPALVSFVGVYAMGRYAAERGAVALCALWCAHYGYRALVYPFRLRVPGKPMPLAVALTGLVFNIWNGSVNALQVSEMRRYGSEWLLDPRFLAGTAVFALGFFVNRHADEALLRLRKPGETGYRVPHGGLYRWVSCPNYLGESLEWAGWALGTFSWAGLAFAVYTLANLAPRARDHHRWYRATFPDYPPERKALVPFVW